MTDKVSSEGHPIYLQLLEEMRALHKKKAADYGSDEDPLDNLRSSAEIGIPPWLGCWLRAKDKVKRINQFCLKWHLANESVEDSFMDLAAYCLLSLTLMREEKQKESASRKEDHEKVVVGHNEMKCPKCHAATATGSLLTGFWKCQNPECNARGKYTEEMNRAGTIGTP